MEKNKEYDYDMDDLVEIKDDTEDTIEEIIEIEEPKIELKSEICKVLWIKNKSFAIDFKDHGISINTEHLLDKEKIGDFIEVKYEFDIGSPDFKLFPVFN